MALDTAARRFGMLAFAASSIVLPIPDGNDFDSSIQRYQAIGVFDVIIHEDGDVMATAGFASAFTASATTYASVAAAIGAGDSDSVIASTIGNVSSAMSTSAATTAIASAVGIVNAGIAAGESWAAAVQSAADFASFAILGDSFVAELAIAQAGLVISTSELAGEFMAASESIGLLIGASSMQAVLQAVALTMASVNVAVSLGAQFDVVEPVVQILTPAKATLIVTPRTRSLRS